MRTFDDHEIRTEGNEGAGLAKGVLLLLMLALPATANAQFVALSGEYSDAAAAIVHLPQNPPSEFTCSNAADARCLRRAQGFFGSPVGTRRTRAARGVEAGLRILPSLASPTGLGVGYAFVVPTFAMTQNASLMLTQNRPVLNNGVVSLESNIAFGLPGSQRARQPLLSQTRRMARRPFAPTNLIAGGQHNGFPITNPQYQFRQSTNTTVSATANGGLENVRLRYVGGLGFGGTMQALLAGRLDVFLAGPVIDNALPSSLQPGVLRTRLGDVGASPALRVQHGAGWNYTTMVMQPAGTIKGFPSAPSVVGSPCNATPPPSPAGCNQVNGFDTNGLTIAIQPAATSTRHLFAWTTGTVSIVRTAVRNGITSTLTVTGMGFDTTSPTSMGGVVRRVGLVAGSFTQRNTMLTSQLNPGIVGVNFELVPEPGTTAALFASLGLLGALARRRGSRPS